MKNKKNKIPADPVANTTDPVVITTESKIITSALFLVICLLFLVIFLGETRSEKFMEQKESGKSAEAGNLYNVAMQYYRANDLSRAIPNFRKAIELSPDFCEPYINLGISYAKLGEKEKAINSLKTALDKDPKEDYLVYLNLAQVYKGFNIEEAKKAFQKAIELHPYPKYAYFDLGDFLWGLNEFDEAVENIEKGLVLHNLKSFYLGSIKRAIRIYSEMPELVEVLKKLVETGATEDVMQKYDNIVFNNFYLKNNQQIADKYGQIGYHYLLKKEYPKAIEYFEKSISIWSSQKNRAYEHLKTAQENE